MKNIEVQRSKKTFDINDFTFEEKEIILSFIFQEGAEIYDNFEKVIKYSITETSKLFNLDVNDAFNFINEHAKEKNSKTLEKFNIF